MIIVSAVTKESGFYFNLTGENKSWIKAGEKVTESASGIMAKLGIMPLKVGFEPIAAYDIIEQKV